MGKEGSTSCGNGQKWLREALMASLLLEICARHGAQLAMGVAAIGLGGRLLCRGQRLAAAEVSSKQHAAVLPACGRKLAWLWARVPQLKVRRLRQVLMLLLSVDALVSAGGAAAVKSGSVLAVMFVLAVLLPRVCLSQLLAACPLPTPRRLERALLAALVLEALLSLARLPLLGLLFKLLQALALASLPYYLARSAEARGTVVRLVMLGKSGAVSLSEILAEKICCLFEASSVEDPWQSSSAGWAPAGSHFSYGFVQPAAAASWAPPALPSAYAPSGLAWSPVMQPDAMAATEALHFARLQSNGIQQSMGPAGIARPVAHQSNGAWSSPVFGTGPAPAHQQSSGMAGAAAAATHGFFAAAAGRGPAAAMGVFEGLSSTACRTVAIGGNLVGAAGASCAQLGSRASQAAGGLGSAAGKPLKALATSGARQATKLAAAGARRGAQLAAAGAVRLASLKATQVVAGPRRGPERRAPRRIATAAAQAPPSKQEPERIGLADKEHEAPPSKKQEPERIGLADKEHEAASQSEADKKTVSTEVDCINKGAKKRPMILPQPEEEEQARFDAALRAVRKRRRLGLAKAAAAA
eukprot:TRINITY_DN1282_c0_g1_i1.p1 TRINITY_DN1282_c0_g1~~TRINITY_DN1282_c0_g1_i1.p1  ORF type:complete len:584 (-),score=123.09 TRINITY_DN1282_c0_g1_i1:144-1895(-)